MQANSEDSAFGTPELQAGIFELKVRTADDISRALARRAAAHKSFACIALIIAVSYAVAWSSVVKPQRVNPAHHPLWQSEHSLRRVPAHISEFGPASPALALPRCGHVRPPEALLTPDPLLPTADDNLLVRVSFIVGSDGHVYSAFILNSVGPDQDRAVLRTVRQWRYRPALCNGVPTDFEARIRFSIP